MLCNSAQSGIIHVKECGCGEFLIPSTTAIDLPVTTLTKPRGFPWSLFDLEQIRLLLYL